MFPALLGQAWAPGGWNLASLIIASVVGATSLIVLALLARYLNLWIQARTTNANVGFLDLIGMTLRKVNPETIIARVGEGIVTTIGSTKSYKLVLQQPDSISKRVLANGLDSGTAFEILSIDIAAIDVGDNIGANLQASQAEADMRVARAKAEERRAFAVAREQEMIAGVQENRAKVVSAEAEVPLAIAEAFRQGNLGITDYYH